jgi:hypothetical protein
MIYYLHAEGLSEVSLPVILSLFRFDSYSEIHSGGEKQGEECYYSRLAAPTARDHVKYHLSASSLIAMHEEPGANENHGFEYVKSLDIDVTQKMSIMISMKEVLLMAIVNYAHIH